VLPPEVTGWVVEVVAIPIVATEVAEVLPPLVVVVEPEVVEVDEDWGVKK
jgi:hypothetical protein